MACERYRDALADVAAGAPAAAEVGAHLASCEACRAELDALRQALAAGDAELAGLAAAEPSPELEVRIRQAVAEANPAPAWRFGWLWPVAAAAATLLVALAVWVGQPPAPRVAVDASRPQRAGSARVVEPAAVEGDEPLVPGSDDLMEPREVRRAGGSIRSGHTGLPRDDTAPEVLVPPGGAEALVRFVALVHSERLSPVALAAAGQPSADLAEPAPLEIKPIEIVPLDLAETSGT